MFVNASKSSQFISGLLISAARFNAGVTIHHVGAPVPSMPHIQMTIAMLAEQDILYPFYVFAAVLTASLVIGLAIVIILGLDSYVASVV